jgi:uncharacterized damage-inducible protein DinB
MIALPLDQLLAYTDFDRAKWRQWAEADPARLQIAFQPGGRFPTIFSMLEHVFLVERRHLSRLQGGTPPETSGIAAGDVGALFEYADLVRADFRKYIAGFSEAEADTPMTIALQSGTFDTNKRTLATHMLLHEVRHFAQIAFAARAGGAEPPGQHDYFYFAQRP